MIKKFTSVRWPKPLAVKLAKLEECLRQTGSALVAFSGGVDSTFLCLMARQVLGRKARAVTADSPSLPRRELAEARMLAKLIGIPHQVIASAEMDNPRFRRNPPDRCYWCKKDRLQALLRIARDKGVAAVVDGSNADDTGDYRPGSRAVHELGVRSPLQEAGLTKAEIREASRRLGLPTADKPSMACLVTRLPHGVRISDSLLQMVEKAEEALRSLGFRVYRVRVHGDLARVELAPAEIARAAAPQLRRRLVQAVQACGFRYVALDLEGYRTGSMNPGTVKTRPQ